MCPQGITARRARAVARPAARQAPRRRGNLPGRARRPRADRSRPAPHPARRGSQQDRPLPARRASGPLPGTGASDGQQNQQTVYPDSRTCHPAAPSANTYSNRGTSRQRSPLSVADVQDTAIINLPVHSPTHISVRLIKQSSVARRRCVTYVNSPPPVRGPVSVPCHLLSPPCPCPQPRACLQARACPAPRGRTPR